MIDSLASTGIATVATHTLIFNLDLMTIIMSGSVQNVVIKIVFLVTLYMSQRKNIETYKNKEFMYIIAPHF